MTQAKRSECPSKTVVTLEMTPVDSEKFTPFPLEVFKSSSSPKLCLLSTKIQSRYGPYLEELATQ